MRAVLVQRSAFVRVRVLLALGLALAGVGGGGATVAHAASRWGADYFPNVPLITQDGNTVQFFDDVLKDKVVAINFIFTSCTNTCPLETAKMRQVQKLLGDRVGKDIFLYSISIDPEHDTPEVLKEYSKKFDVAPGWTFLTGKEEDITLVRKKLGLTSQLEAKDLDDHSLTLIVGNQTTGVWMKRSPNDDSQVLARLLGETLHNFAAERVDAANTANYAAASRLPKYSPGEALFRQRCVSCHTIGGGAGIGPDLVGVVQQRDHAWLVRWIQVPDEMLAEKDPLAIALFEEYRQVPMPNLKLTEAEAIDLIEFMRAGVQSEEPQRAAAQDLDSSAR